MSHQTVPLTLLILFFSIAPCPGSSHNKAIFREDHIHHPIVATNGMISSAEKHATIAGLEVLKEGGNAVDAAVTVAFVLAVTYPRAGNIGGGGFMLIHLQKDNKTIALDYREKAPELATEDMFLDKHGNVDKNKSQNSILSVGVPGTVAGLCLALEKYGTISLKRALQPAIKLAEQGFEVDHEFRESLIKAKKKLSKHRYTKEIFFPKGKIPEVGDIFRQPHLAKTLKLISEKGASAFYSQEIAQKIAKFMKSQGGLITEEDLKNYKPVLRTPVKGTYRGYEIYSMPPPSSGGVHLIQMLNMLELFPLSKYGHNSAKTIHLMAETMKLAYADRFRYMGDPDFVEIPVAQLISKDYAKSLTKKINTKKATPSIKISPGNPYNTSANNTTHFSVIDKKGNVVANTYTLNFSFGSGIAVTETGILLNNEMDDFTAKPGAPNAYGLIGGKPNIIEPGKRMLSSMTPVIVMKNKKPFFATGSPGGSMIITTVLQIILNIIDHNMNLATATASPRIHHQWYPDVLYLEKGISPDTIKILKEMGHKIKTSRTIGSAHSVMSYGKYLYGYCDPRRRGCLAAGF